MSFGVDASVNYRTWGNVQAVRLSSHAKLGDTNFEIATAKRRAPNFKEVTSSGGVYTSQDVVWLLPKTLLDTAGATGNKAPKPGDKINDLEGVGTLWTILECPLNTLRSTYRCMTRNLILAYDLRSALSVRRPGATTTDNAGSRTYAYTTPYDSIPCRFQETASRVADERGKRVTVRDFTVTVDRRLYLTIEDQIVDADGEIYELLSWDNADRIDQLQTLNVRRAWGTIQNAGA